MSEPKFTPGPWNAEDREERFVVFADHFHAELASLSCYQDDAETDEQAKALQAEQEANAHLIAAAPELLDALQKLAVAYEEQVGPQRRAATTLALVRAALEKAVGP